MKTLFYWKVKIPEIKRILKVFAYSAKECDYLVKAWLERQGLPDLSYNKGYSGVASKKVPSDIVEQEYKHLCLETIN